MQTCFMRKETGECGITSKVINMYNINGYRPIFCSRDNRSAGVAMYVKNVYETLEWNNGCVS